MIERNSQWACTADETSVGSEVYDLIRTRVRSGRLPFADGYRLSGGKGDGSLCACCDRIITGAEIQFDIEFRAARGSWVSLAMHLACFELWRNLPNAQAQGLIRERAPERTSERLGFPS